MDTPTVVFLKHQRSINLNHVISVQAIDADNNVITDDKTEVVMLQVQCSFGWHVLLNNEEDINRFDHAWSQFNWSRKVDS